MQLIGEVVEQVVDEVVEKADIRFEGRFSKRGQGGCLLACMQVMEQQRKYRG